MLQSKIIKCSCERTDLFTLPSLQTPPSMHIIPILKHYV
uniref:Uncharacterized protein n=1 Tax=Anguilla anguilla TaxID=7936 RepID=A0A0E9XSS3_ANGAN